MNLMDILYTEGLIDEKMYAVYMDYQEDSSIRFGSYDKGGVAESAQFTSEPSNSNRMFDFNV